MSKTNRRFWNWVKNEQEENPVRELHINGVIAEESWYDDDVTPKLFREELLSEEGDVVLFLNSPGGDIFAASRIYTMLMEYKGSVTVKVDGIAASAASVIAMAGTEVLMSPTSCMMIHNPFTIAFGDTDDMQKVIAMLDEIKESIINAYELKTNMSRVKISHLMDSETWMNANKAVELGFADGILYTERSVADNFAFAFSARAAANTFLNKINLTTESARRTQTEKPRTGVSKEQLVKRLNLLKP